MQPQVLERHPPHFLMGMAFACVWPGMAKSIASITLCVCVVGLSGGVEAARLRSTHSDPRHLPGGRDLNQAIRQIRNYAEKGVTGRTLPRRVSVTYDEFDVHVAVGSRQGTTEFWRFSRKELFPRDVAWQSARSARGGAVVGYADLAPDILGDATAGFSIAKWVEGSVLENQRSLRAMMTTRPQPHRMDVVLREDGAVVRDMRKGEPAKMSTFDPSSIEFKVLRSAARSGPAQLARTLGRLTPQ
jgi:hypothetical protein